MVAAAHELLTLMFYGLRDQYVRRMPSQPLPRRPRAA
jgi:hypothetical protein